MKTKFLEKVADFLLQIEQTELAQTAVVFPNRRSEIFLRNYLKNLSTKSIWLPEFYSIDEFLVNLSGMVEVDPVHIYFELFAIHKKIAGDEARSLDDFLLWAPIILNDFNDIDLHLADPEKVFTHLSEARALEVWNLNKMELTDLQKNYLSFYQSLYEYYKQLNLSLREKNAGYKGMIYKYLANHVHEKFRQRHWKRLVLVGFNALSESETNIFGQLIETSKVDVLWDIDSYYFSDEPNQPHEAGRFIKKLVQRWKLKDINWVTDDLLTDKNKKIKILGVPKQIGQVRFAAQQLTEWLQNDGTSETDKQVSGLLLNTAVVLADENLLLPMLNSLPEIKDADGKKVEFNITMGYPLTNSAFALLVNDWLELMILHTESRKDLFAVTNMLGILNNPICEFALKDESPEKINQAIQQILSFNNAYLQKKDLKEIFTTFSSNGFELMSNILNPAGQPLKFIDSFVQFLEMTRASLESDNMKDALLREQLISMFSLSKKLASYFTRFENEITFKTIRQIFNQLLRQSQVSLKGEPLNGVQVMGMLETRNLDFQNIVLLSANEGILPKPVNLESFLPFDIRRNYHFPLPADKTDVFAYHFYRLVQHAQNITLVYNSEPDALGGGEKSRFILQLEKELKIANPDLDIKDGLVRIPFSSVPDDPGISIRKTDDIMEILAERTAKGLSPTALTSFIKCSLQFYFKYILNLAPLDTASESIEANIFGSVVHNVLEYVFKPFKGKQIDPLALKKELANIDSLVIKEFHSEFKGGNIESGKNLLIVEVAKKYIHQYITQEIADLREQPRKLLDTEEDKRIVFEAGGRDISLRGRVDRVDQATGTNRIRIVDYKTGSVRPENLKIKDWDDLFEKSDLEKAFQVLFYTLLYNKSASSSNEYESGIISMRSLSNGFMSVKLPDEISMQEGIPVFEEKMKSLIEKLLDTETPFEQTMDEKNCSYCDFKNICNRKGKAF